MALPSGMRSVKGKRATTYYAKFRSRGVLVQKKLSADLPTAKRMLRDLRRKAEDRGPATNNTAWILVRDAFLTHKKSTIDGWKAYEQDLTKFEDTVRVVSIANINYKLIDEFRQARREEEGDISIRTINRQIGTVKNCLSWAASRDVALISHSPIRDVKPIKQVKFKKNRRALELAEIKVLKKHLPGYVLLPIEFIVCTGTRKREVCDAKFSDIDLTSKVWKIGSKRKVRQIPLTDRLVEIVKSQQETAKERPRNQDLVFATPWGNNHYNNLLKKFYSCAKAAGIVDAKSGGSIDIHSLRGTFATMSIDAGASPKAVQAVLGHSTLQMTMDVYTKLRDKSKIDAISKVEF